MKLLSVCFILTLNAGLSFGTILPLLQPVLCSLSSSNISGCVLKAILTIKPQIISGNYGNGATGPSLDPYKLALSVSNPDGFTCTITNTFIYGARNLQITSLVMVANTIYIAVNLPYVLVQGQYTLNMVFGGLLPINGAGSFNMTDTDSSITLVFTMAAGQNNLVTFPTITVNFVFNSPTLYLTGVFPGNPGLDGFANQIINAHPGIILNEIQPSLNQQIAGTLRKIVSSLLAGTLFSEIFLP